MLAKPCDVNAVVDLIVEEHNDLAGTYLSTKVAVSAGTLSRVSLITPPLILRPVPSLWASYF